MKALIILFLLPLQLLSQDISGIWTGFIHTQGNDLLYELVISENNEKLSGYSLMIFAIDSIENMGIKSVILKKKNGNISIEDDKLMYNNYTTTAKRLKLLGTLSLNVEDSLMTLIGRFHTRLLDYRSSDNTSYTGTINLQRQKNSAVTKLISQLDKMNLLNSLSFIQPKTLEKEKMAIAAVPVEKLQPSLPEEKEKEKVLAPLIIKEPLMVVTEKPVEKGKQIDTLSSKEMDKNIPASTVETNPKEATVPVASVKEPVPPKEREEQIDSISKKVTEKNVQPVAETKPKDATVPVASVKEPTPPKEREEQIDSIFKRVAEKNVQPVAETKPKEIRVPVASVKEPTPAKEKEKQIDSISKGGAEKKVQPVLEAKPKETTVPVASVKEPTPAKEKEKQIDSLSKGVAEKKLQPVLETKPKIPQPPVIKTMEPTVTVNAAASIAERKTEVIRSVFFRSDSLVLSLYDNGTIDGDTVSVVMNGRIIIAKKRLTENALRVVVQMTPDFGDSILLTMYAENLGSIPPNTGLLFIQDGNDRYEIRFEGDMQKSSAVNLRRKR